MTRHTPDPTRSRDVAATAAVTATNRSNVCAYLRGSGCPLGWGVWSAGMWVCSGKNSDSCPRSSASLATSPGRIASCVGNIATPNSITVILSHPPLRPAPGKRPARAARRTKSSPYCGYCARSRGEILHPWAPRSPRVAFRSVRGARGTLLFRRRAADEAGPRPGRSRAMTSRRPGPDEVAAAMARMSAAVAYQRLPRPATPTCTTSLLERGPWRPSIARFAVTWVIAVAAAVAIFFAAQAMLRAPQAGEHAGRRDRRRVRDPGRHPDARSSARPTW